MIRMLLLLVLFVAGIYFGPMAAGQKGYVLIAMDNLTIEMSVVSGLIMLTLSIGALLLLEWFIRKLLRADRDSRNWLRTRKQRRAYRLMSEGMLALAEENWKKAEKLCAKSSKHSPTPLLSYLVAAEAAQAQDKQAQRDDYLQKAHGDEDNEPLALSLTRLKLLIDHGQNEEALSRLTVLRTRHPKHLGLLKLQMAVYRNTQSWGELLGCIKQARKVKAQSDRMIEQMEVEAYEGYMSRLAVSEGSDGLGRYWKGLPKATRQKPQLFVSYCRIMRSRNAGPQVVNELVERCRDQQQQILLDELSLHQLNEAETLWTQSKRWKLSDSAEKQSLLGHLALQAQHYDAADEHLNQALSLHQSSRDFMALSRVYEAQGDTQRALEASRKGVALGFADAA